MDQSKKIIAVFDFDGTLTLGDSLPHFFIFLNGRLRTALKFTLLLPYLIGFVLGMSSRQKTKERILQSFLKGLPQNFIEKKGIEFAESNLNRLLRKEAMQKLRWHQSQGHCCLLISANLNLYLHHWAKINGFQHAISSECEVSSEGILTGRLQGKNCWGMEKVRRLNQLLGSSDHIIYAYGDSEGDRELLAHAHYPFYRRFNHE